MGSFWTLQSSLRFNSGSPWGDFGELGTFEAKRNGDVLHIYSGRWVERCRTFFLGILSHRIHGAGIYIYIYMYIYYIYMYIYIYVYIYIYMYIYVYIYVYIYIYIYQDLPHKWPRYVDSNIPYMDPMGKSPTSYPTSSRIDRHLNVFDEESSLFGLSIFEKTPGRLPWIPETMQGHRFLIRIGLLFNVLFGVNIVPTKGSLTTQISFHLWRKDQTMMWDDPFKILQSLPY